MTYWKRFLVLLEKNGLVVISVAIIAIYVALTIITDGEMASLIMITLSLLAFGVFTQFLINEQKAAKDSLREREQQHRLLIEKLPLAVFVQTDGKIVYVNEAFLTLFKASSAEEVIGIRLNQFVPAELYDLFEKRNRLMTDKKELLPPQELNLRCMDGTVVTVVSTPMPIAFQGQAAILTALYDITALKRGEIELQKTRKLHEIQAREIERLKAELEGTGRR